MTEKYFCMPGDIKVSEMREYLTDEPLFFLHIPRTGGNSLWAALKIWFGEDKAHMVNPENPLPALPGHVYRQHFDRSVGWDIEKAYPEADQFITMLRNPFDRVKSWYRHWKQVGSIGEKTTLEEFINVFRKKISLGLKDNLPQEYTYPHILSDFVFVGITERMQESLDCLAKILGRERIVAPHINKSTGSTFSTADETCRLGSAMFDDVLIYEYARNLFSKELMNRGLDAR